MMIQIKGGKLIYQSTIYNMKSQLLYPPRVYYKHTIQIKKVNVELLP